MVKRCSKCRQIKCRCKGSYERSDLTADQAVMTPSFEPPPASSFEPPPSYEPPPASHHEPPPSYDPPSSSDSGGGNDFGGGDSGGGGASGDF